MTKPNLNKNNQISLESVSKSQPAIQKVSQLQKKKYDRPFKELFQIRKLQDQKDLAQYEALKKLKHDIQKQQIARRKENSQEGEKTRQQKQSFGATKTKVPEGKQKPPKGFFNSIQELISFNLPSETSYQLLSCQDSQEQQQDSTKTSQPNSTKNFFGQTKLQYFEGNKNE